jgi:putative transposase
MAYDPQRHQGRLQRLSDEHYQGRAFVHWTMAMDSRVTGWLDALHHAKLREWMSHALGRYRVVCPVYVLMPDHSHFLWIGANDGSDQKLAAKLLREAWNHELRMSGPELQRQAYDHVLREDERERGAFGTVANYVLENPVRAELTERWQDYEFLGALVPGYPRLDPRDDDFWERFWRIYDGLGANAGQEG